MWFVRQVLEVVVPQSDNGDVESTRKDFSEVCWNVFLVDEDEIVALDKLNSIKENIFLIKNGMTRVSALVLVSIYYLNL